MNGLRRLWIAIPAGVLLVLLVLLYQTRGTMEDLQFLRRRGGTPQGLVDQSAWQTAATLVPMAVSAEEQAYAREAARLADHEVDQAFSMALREAGMQRHALTGAALAEAHRAAALKATVAQDKVAVDLATAAAAKSGVPAAEGDDLALARAQLGFDVDDLQDATEDLQRASGDQRARIQEESQAREAAEKKAPGGGEGAVAAAKHYGTLWGRASAWFAQKDRAGLLNQAGTKARIDALALAGEHSRLEDVSERDAGQAMGLTGAARVKALDTMGSERVVMSILDDRVQSENELATVYGKWEAQVWLQHRIVTHLLLQSLAWVAAMLLLTAAITVGGRTVLGRWGTDERRRQTLERIFTLGVQVFGAVAVLLVVFGVPQQMPTILGLATAGLTVVFQDFILAFFGWFVLMGRNGIRVCDWVEIDGTGGEVSEIGLFRTTLLETGNWTSRGHPTGRKVTFTNSFAIRGTYFNYTTHGQWMWDEIQVSVGTRAYEVIGKLLAVVQAEAATDTEEAEAEWRTVSGRVGLGNFSAAPTVDVRPAASGVDVIVRFVTRAAARFERRNRIYGEVMKVLRDGDEAGRCRKGEYSGQRGPGPACGFPFTANYAMTEVRLRGWRAGCSAGEGTG